MAPVTPEFEAARAGAPKKSPALFSPLTIAAAR